jgi:hypothetical protein
MFRGDAKNTKKCKNKMYRTKQLMGKMSVFAKQIPFFGYENFVEDSNNLAKIRRKFYFKKIHLDVNFETF